MTDTVEKDFERYAAAVHAMQSGVAAEMGHNPGPTEPKHLRVGVNVAIRDHSSLAKLLMAKGVITEAEFAKAIADGMEEEVKDYEQRLSARYGTEVRLS